MGAATLCAVTVSVRLAPMTADEYDAYRVVAERDYADEIVRSGAMPEVEARAKASADYARLLPQGLGTPDHLLWTAWDGHAPVGLVWVELSERSDGPGAFVYDVQVAEGLRGRGYGRAVMLAAEEACRERGATSVRLNVFGGNHVARGLYERLGFETTSVQMRKNLA